MEARNGSRCRIIPSLYTWWNWNDCATAVPTRRQRGTIANKIFLSFRGKLVYNGGLCSASGRSPAMCFRCLDGYVAQQLPLYLASMEDSMVSFIAVSFPEVFCFQPDEAKRPLVYGVTVFHRIPRVNAVRTNVRLYAVCVYCQGGGGG